MLGISGWVGLRLGFYSVAVTLLTLWLAAQLGGRGQAAHLWSPRAIAGNLLWSVILFLGGILAVRYVERLENPVLAAGTCALLGLLLSLARAFLRLRAAPQGPAAGRRPPQPAAWSRAVVVRSLAYILLALILFLVISGLAGERGNPILLIPLFAGALLPDLDSSASLVGRLLPALARPLEAWLGRGGVWHTPAMGLLLAILTSPLALVFPGSLAASATLLLGFVTHLLLDLLGPPGIMLLWPLSRKRYHFAAASLVVEVEGSPSERRFVAGLAIVALVLLLLVRMGPEPPPAPAPAPSYDETLNRYHGLRGRYLVFGSVQGTWQASGLRLSGQLFEVLNAVESSYVLLDRYTGKVFTAGHSPQDHFYLESISLQTGSRVQIKPAQIWLEDETLSACLDVLYEMQREPGLQYTYVFGDVLLPAGTGIGPPLDHTLTEVPRIQAEEPGHYRLQYLPAAELIALADVEVKTANLLIVATCISPPAGPTPTPLPPSPTSGEVGP